MTLVPQSLDIEKAVKAGQISTLNALMTALAEAEAVQAQAEQDATDEAVEAVKTTGKALALTESNRVLLRTIPVQLADVVLPDEARHLTDDEARKLVPLYEDIKKAAGALGKAEDSIKQAFHNHIDQDAPTGSEVDKSGHAVSEGQVAVDGVDNKIVRGLVGGKPTGIIDADLQALEEAGLIDHKTYLSLTVVIPATRTVAPDEKVMAVIKKNPGLIKILATKAGRTPVHTAIRIAKND